MDVERSDNVLVPMKKLKKQYYMVTVNPYKSGDEIWEDIACFRQEQILQDMLEEIKEKSGWEYIDHQIEEAARGRHIHIVMKQSPSGSMTPAGLSKMVHKKFGKPRLNRNICCNVRMDSEPDGFLWYVRKTRPKCFGVGISSA